MLFKELLKEAADGDEQALGTLYYKFSVKYSGRFICFFCKIYV